MTLLTSIGKDVDDPYFLLWASLQANMSQKNGATYISSQNLSFYSLLFFLQTSISLQVNSVCDFLRENEDTLRFALFSFASYEVRETVQEVCVIVETSEEDGGQRRIRSKVCTLIGEEIV